MRKLKGNFITMMLVRDIHKLEHDPKTQYKFNRNWCITWALCMVGVLAYPKLYHHEIPTLIIEEVSLWANFATHFSGMSSALAAINTTKTSETLTDSLEDLNEDLDDIHQVVVPPAEPEHA